METRRQNRYDVQHNFVVARPEPEVIQVPDQQPMEPANISAVWTPTVNQSRDSTSSQDRAKGFLLRMVPVYVAVFILSIAVTVIYSLVTILADVSAPYALDRVLVFLLALAAMAFHTHLQGDKRDREHSVAGVERHRISTAADIRKAEIAAELELRTKALDASLRLLEGRQDSQRMIGPNDD